ncbi:MAG: cellobiose phosphorylase [Candidatus Omnitrophica bacterium]|nr:cellobiose phosphorylase [Candidatus Omnitrophota bacterium]
MPIWKIKDRQQGVFSIENPQDFSDFYLGLTNTQGKIFCCISPFLSGDIKTSIHNYLNYPATVFDLKSPAHTRSLWLYFNKKNIINISHLWPTQDKLTLEAGPLWQKLTRENKSRNLKIETTSFVPEGTEIEIMWIKITNRAKYKQEFTATTSIPLFCRAQENIIDHRHVTSLLNRAYPEKEGLIIKPAMSFDERGHKKNKTSYFVFAFTDKKRGLEGIFSTLDEFYGKNGNIIWPESVFLNKKPKNIDKVWGKENIAGLKFKKHSLKPKESLNIFLVMGITDKDPGGVFKGFSEPDKIYKAFKESKKAWAKIFSKLNSSSGNNLFDFWLSWVNLQPTLRKLFGCSFLAHFDYGKGGRGWRDLWQDLLSLLLINPSQVKKNLIRNFQGIRIDGSNATIITKDNDFISDRNKISRVWMDHGVWPYLTTKLYIDRTADWDILFKKVSFFRDHQLKRAKEQNFGFFASKRRGFELKDGKNRTHKSSILEHLLVQNIVQFFNIGTHGNTKLENADWNDALDMAAEKGESVAFTCMYACNLESLANLIKEIKLKKKINQIEITKELLTLIDTAGAKIDYSDLNKRGTLLKKYLEITKSQVEGKKVKINIDILINDLTRKASWIKNHIQTKEWQKDAGFFNGYYDNNSRRVEGRFNNKIRMSLTSQVFPLMSKIATTSQAKRIWESLVKYLKEGNYSAFRLNTDFGEIKLDLGRAFGFSYGDKENGSVFSHMNVMLAFSLYEQNLVKEGLSVIESLFGLATSKESRIGPGLAEYFNLEHKGLYPYLTGSASWFILVWIRQAIGLKFRQGNIIFEPKLLAKQFAKDSSLKTILNLEGKILNITYLNPKKKDWPNYTLEKVRINAKAIKLNKKLKSLELNSLQTKKLLSLPENSVEITFG